MLFLHTRKTAGISIRGLLFNRFPAARTLLNAEFAERLAADWNDYDFITGHLHAGYRSRREGPVDTLTFLRQPLERALSAYFFYEAMSPEQLAFFRRVLPPAMGESRARFITRSRELGLVRFLRDEEPIARAWLSNVQTRVLAGWDDGLDCTATDDELLTRARQQLRELTLVGITERLEESVALLQRQRGWCDLGPILYENRNRQRPERDAIERDALARLADWNQLDAQLYDEANALLTQRLRHVDTAPHVVDPPPPCDARQFTFDQPIHGRGWHLREFYNGEWLCWTGAESVTTLQLRSADSTARQLRCRVAHLLHPSVLAALEVRVNGQPVAMSWTGGDTTGWLSGRLPASETSLHASLIQLEFHTHQRIRPEDLHPGCGDTRPLGIALAEIRVES